MPRTKETSSLQKWIAKKEIEDILRRSTLNRKCMFTEKLVEIKPSRSDVNILKLKHKQLSLGPLFDAHLGGLKGYRNGV